MKNIFFLLLTIALLGSCRDRDQQVSTVVPVVIPRITLNGPEYLSLSLNESYADEGAVAFDTLLGETVNLEPQSNTIDVTAPGLYVVTFYYRNKNGFDITKERYVAVTSVSPDINLSGLYLRTSNDAPVNVSKIGTGLYRIDNVGGVTPASSPAVLPVVMAMINDSTITIPAQSVPNDYGVLDCLEEQISFTPDTSFSYKIDNPGFGAATRTFLKQ